MGIGKRLITYSIPSNLINIAFCHVKPEEYGQPRPNHTIDSMTTQEIVDFVKGWEDDIVTVAEIGESISVFSRSYSR